MKYGWTSASVREVGRGINSMRYIPSFETQGYPCIWNKLEGNLGDFKSQSEPLPGVSRSHIWWYKGARGFTLLPHLACNYATSECLPLTSLSHGYVFIEHCKLLCVKDYFRRRDGKLSNCFKIVARDLYCFFTNNSQAGWSYPLHLRSRDTIL